VKNYYTLGVFLVKFKAQNIHYLSVERYS